MDPGANGSSCKQHLVIEMGGTVCIEAADTHTWCYHKMSFSASLQAPVGRVRRGDKRESWAGGAHLSFSLLFLGSFPFIITIIFII